MREYLKDLADRARYLGDRAFAREFAGQLGLFLLLVIVFTIIGMTATFFGLFSAENAEVRGIRRGIDAGLWDSLCAGTAAIVCKICEGTPIGACCFEGGTCDVLAPQNCEFLGGVYQGDGNFCGEIECDAP